MLRLKIIFTILIIIIISEAILISFLLRSKSGSTSKEEQKEEQKIVNELDFTKGLENVFIQVRIKQETKDGMFNDSLYYSADEWAKMSAEAVQTAINDRVAKWTDMINQTAR